MAFSEETGDRIAWTKVEQMQSNRYEVVAYYVSCNYIIIPSSIFTRVCTIESRINVGHTLINFGYSSHPYALIRVPMLNSFWEILK